MRLLVATEHHFLKNREGVIYSGTGGRDRVFWNRYLEVFSEVMVVARVAQTSVIPQNKFIANGPGIKFIELPDYNGSAQYLKLFRKLQYKVRSVPVNGAAVILRVPGAVAGLVRRELKNSHPYGAEVVGSPYDVFAPGAVKHPLRPFFRWWFSRQLRQQCAHASATAYVTEFALQRRYPPSDKAFTTHYSSIELPEESFVSRPKIISSGQNCFTLIFVGTLAQLYKAPDVLIDAVQLCKQWGLNLRLVLVGEGQYRHALEAKVAVHDMEGKISFLGQLAAGTAVRAELDKADVFVLPSLTEGLPRAIIEAMARGLPCIGSNVGGIPELLLPEDMVPPGNANALAQKIREIVTNPARMVQMSARNLAKAREYHNDILRERRLKFLQYVKQATLDWLNSQQ